MTSHSPVWVGWIIPLLVSLGGSRVSLLSHDSQVGWLVQDGLTHMTCTIAGDHLGYLSSPSGLLHARSLG